MNQRQRVYQVSANREHASHKLRYVERSAPTTGECRLCVGVPSVDPQAEVQGADVSPQHEGPSRPDCAAPAKV